jgi:hypothetical protein
MHGPLHPPRTRCSFLAPSASCADHYRRRAVPTMRPYITVRHYLRAPDSAGVIQLQTSPRGVLLRSTCCPACRRSCCCVRRVCYRASPCAGYACPSRGPGGCARTVVTAPPRRPGRLRQQRPVRCVDRRVISSGRCSRAALCYQRPASFSTSTAALETAADATCLDVRAWLQPGA